MNAVWAVLKCAESQPENKILKNEAKLKIRAEKNGGKYTLN